MLVLKAPISTLFKVVSCFAAIFHNRSSLLTKKTSVVVDQIPWRCAYCRQQSINIDWTAQSRGVFFFRDTDQWKSVRIGAVGVQFSSNGGIFQNEKYTLGKIKGIRCKETCFKTFKWCRSTSINHSFYTTSVLCRFVEQKYTFSRSLFAPVLFSSRTQGWQGHISRPCATTLMTLMALMDWDVLEIRDRGPREAQSTQNLMRKLKFSFAWWTTNVFTEFLQD